MVIEEEVLPYLTWLFQGNGSIGIEGTGAVVQFAVIAASIFVVTFLIGFLVSLVRYGPVKAGELSYRTVVGGLSELLRISPRRIGAIAWLAVKESLRGRVFVSLIVFALILLFANWYLQSNNTDPARLYLNFVLTTTTYLILMLSLLLSAFSLPNDIKSKTIYTIVTKPVRPGDIVIGRMLGFTYVGTILLAIMAIGSWIFVNGALSHSHEVASSTLTEVTSSAGETLGQQGKTSRNAFHTHDIEMDTHQHGTAIAYSGHTHAIVPGGNAGTVQASTGYLRARVPQRGKLIFVDTKGVKVKRGISVGNEWSYRSFIQGASQASANWTFTGISENNLQEYADGSGQYLPIEMIVRVYRSWQGDINKLIQGSIQLRNPETGVKTTIEVFDALDAQIDTFKFSNEQVDTDQNDITIVDDLISSNGEIEIVVQCLDRSQYFGFAQADCFIQLPEGSVLWNFIKGYLSIWMQMVIVIAIAVTTSTFLSGPIAMIFTIAFIVLGFFREFFVEIALGKSYGGGPVESFVRMITQMNQTSPFDATSPAVNVMKGIDGVLTTMMHALSYILPDFSSFLGRVNYVSNGFSIPGDALGRDFTICLVYVLGLAIAGYFSMRSREVAK